MNKFKDTLNRVISDVAAQHGTTPENLQSGPIGKQEAAALVAIVAKSTAGLTSAAMLKQHAGIDPARVKQAQRFIIKSNRPRRTNNREI